MAQMLYAQGKNPGTHGTEDCVGLDIVAKREVLHMFTNMHISVSWNMK